MIIKQEVIRNSLLYKLYNNIIYELIIRYFYPITIENKENVYNGDISCIYISRHTTHNYELLLGLNTLNRSSKKLIRGLGHYFIYFFCPWYLFLGVLIGTKSIANELIKNNEYIFVIPGGAEEMTFSYENANKPIWESKSKKYKTGFARLAYENNLPVIPVHGKNVEYMVFSPVHYFANKIGITRLYNRMMEKTINMKMYKILYVLKMFFTALFCGILAFPVKKNISLKIGDHLYKRDGESLIEFTKRCEQELYRIMNN